MIDPPSRARATRSTAARVQPGLHLPLHLHTQPAIAMSDVAAPGRGCLRFRLLFSPLQTCFVGRAAVLKADFGAL